MEYKTFIEHKYVEGKVLIYMVRQQNNFRDFLTIRDGITIATRIEEGVAIPEDGYYLKLPIEVFDCLLSGMVEHQERKGGAPTQQSLRGEVKRFENEVAWLRSLIKPPFQL